MSKKFVIPPGWIDVTNEGTCFGLIGLGTGHGIEGDGIVDVMRKRIEAERQRAAASTDDDAATNKDQTKIRSDDGSSKD